MNENPTYDRQCNRGGETAGKKLSGGCRIETGSNQGDHIQGNEQNDADQRGNLLRGLFFHGKPPCKRMKSNLCKLRLTYYDYIRKKVFVHYLKL